jgi:hypothetical protein
MFFFNGIFLLHNNSKVDRVFTEDDRGAGSIKENAGQV